MTILRSLAFCLVVSLAGCPSATPELEPLAPAEPLRPLRVLVVADAPLATAIEREWSARTGDKLEVGEASLAEFEQGKYEAADVLIYPPGYLGELAERGKIVPVSEETINSDAFNRRDLLPLVRQYEMRWGDKTYAVPLACPRFSLLYRADVFEKLGLQPPSTWKEYLVAAERLSDRSALAELAPTAAEPWSGTLEPLAEGWRSEMLLARVAGSIRRPGQLSDLFDFVSMDALVAAPPFVAALEQMQAAATCQPTDALSITPAEARQRFLNGQAAMAITWLPSPQGAGSELDPQASSLPIGVASLPGSDRFFDFEANNWEPHEGGPARVPLVGLGGRIASVTSSSSRKSEAFDLLALLAGPDWSAAVARRSVEAYPFRRAQVKQIGAWLPPTTSSEAADECRAHRNEQELSSLVMVSLRLPGRARYIAALNASIAKVIAGEDTAEVAAEETAAAWDSITEEIGVANQRSAYRRSSGSG